MTSTNKNKQRLAFGIKEWACSNGGFLFLFLSLSYDFNSQDLMVMDDHQILTAISNAQKGIWQYLEIMKLFPETNVAHDRNFQRKYNAFYRVRQRNDNWYRVYYQYMEDTKRQQISFPEVLQYFRMKLNRYEPSFSSKLLATHNPDMPVWDLHVLSNIGLRQPPYYSLRKFDLAVSAYQALQDWYKEYEFSQEGMRIIRLFDSQISESNLITTTKKIDFVLW